MNNKSNRSSFDDVLAMLDELLAKARSVPLTGLCLISAEKMNNLIYEARNSIPQEIQSARDIVSAQKKILAKAEEDAERIVKNAQEKARQLIDSSEIHRQAKLETEKMRADAYADSQNIQKGMFQLIDKMLEQNAKMLFEHMSEFKEARDELKKKLAK